MGGGGQQGHFALTPSLQGPQVYSYLIKKVISQQSLGIQFNWIADLLFLVFGLQYSLDRKSYFKVLYIYIHMAFWVGWRSHICDCPGLHLISLRPWWNMSHSETKQVVQTTDHHSKFQWRADLTVTHTAALGSLKLNMKWEKHYMRVPLYIRRYPFTW
jgi:hypothetical protein